MSRVERQKARQFLKGFGNEEGQAFVRGRENERRANRLMQELVAEGRIKGVSRSTLKQHQRGIDFWIYPVSRTEGFRIPYQVKSSANAARSFRAERLNPNDIAVLVVNDAKPDSVVKEDIIRNIRIWISQNRRAGMAEVVNAPV